MKQRGILQGQKWINLMPGWEKRTKKISQILDIC